MAKSPPALAEKRRPDFFLSPYSKKSFSCASGPSTSTTKPKSTTQNRVEEIRNQVKKIRKHVKKIRNRVESNPNSEKKFF